MAGRGEVHFCHRFSGLCPQYLSYTGRVATLARGERSSKTRLSLRCVPDFHLPEAPETLRVSTQGPTEMVLGSRVESSRAGAKTQMSWPLEAEFLEPASGNSLGFVVCCFVSEFPGDDSGNSTLRSQPPERIATFLKSLETSFPGRGRRGPRGVRFQVGVGRSAHSGAQARSPVRLTAETSAGRLETGPRRLRAEDLGGTSAPSTPPRPQGPAEVRGRHDARSAPDLRCSRVPGRCSRRKDLAPGPGRPWAPTPAAAPLISAPAAAAHSPPPAPPVEPGGLSQPRRRAAGGGRGAGRGGGGGGGGGWTGRGGACVLGFRLLPASASCQDPRRGTHGVTTPSPRPARPKTRPDPSTLPTLPFPSTPPISHCPGYTSVHSQEPPSFQSRPLMLTSELPILGKPFRILPLYFHPCPVPRTALPLPSDFRPPALPTPLDPPSLAFSRHPDHQLRVPDPALRDPALLALWWGSSLPNSDLYIQMHPGSPGYNPCLWASQVPVCKMGTTVPIS